jgi:hypothetical protein
VTVITTDRLISFLRVLRTPPPTTVVPQRNGPNWELAISRRIFKHNIALQIEWTREYDERGNHVLSSSHLHHLHKWVCMHILLSPFANQNDCRWGCTSHDDMIHIKKAHGLSDGQYTSYQASSWPGKTSSSLFILAKKTGLVLSLYVRTASHAALFVAWLQI